MRAVVDLYMESANQAFEEGGITPRLVLAHSSLVDYAEVSTSVDVGRLESPFDGHMDEVHGLRNEHAADLVHLLTTHQLRSPYGTASGILWNESLAQADDVSFAVTARYEDTFTHEIGHNFGLVHNRWYSTPDSYGIYPYAYGYRNKRAFEPGALESAGWRTLMATDGHCRDLNFQCPRLLRFSNPDQTHLGDPWGARQRPNDGYPRACRRAPDDQQYRSLGGFLSLGVLYGVHDPPAHCFHGRRRGRGERGDRAGLLVGSHGPV